MLAPVFSKSSPALQLFDLPTSDLCLVFRGALCLSLPPLSEPLLPSLCSRRNRDNESGGYNYKFALCFEDKQSSTVLMEYWTPAFEVTNTVNRDLVQR